MGLRNGLLVLLSVAFGAGSVAACGSGDDTRSLKGTPSKDGEDNTPLGEARTVANEMKLGQEIYGVHAASLNVVAQNRTMADPLHVDLSKLYGVVNQTVGDSIFKSPGQPSGILV